jgi:Mn2+/Fe2+ NRAMP family transporter
MGAYANGRTLNVVAWGCVALVVVLDVVLLASAAAEALGIDIG